MVQTYLGKDFLIPLFPSWSLREGGCLWLREGFKAEAGVGGVCTSTLCFDLGGPSLISSVKRASVEVFLKLGSLLLVSCGHQNWLVRVPLHLQWNPGLSHHLSITRGPQAGSRSTHLLEFSPKANIFLKLVYTSFQPTGRSRVPSRGNPTVTPHARGAPCSVFASAPSLCFSTLLLIFI